MVQYSDPILTAFILIIVFSLVIRLVRNNKGRKYSVAGIFMTPVIYILLTAYFVIGLALWQDVVLLVLIVAGVFAGLELGKRADIFEKDGKVLYKRSNEVMALWMIGFIVRLGIDFFYNPYIAISTSGAPLNATTTAAIMMYESSPIVFGADVLLAFSAGLLLGEAIVLYRKHVSIYKKN